MPQRHFARNRTYLLPPSTDEWVPATHPVRFLAMVVDDLPASVWDELGIALDPNDRGAPRYAPEVLLSVWLAGFTFGIRTTRKLAYACQYDLSFIWLTGGQRPDHHTLWQFYATHRSRLRSLLKQTVRMAVAANLLDLQLQAVDGTKIEANAARERSLTADELAALEARLDAEIAHLEAQHQGDEERPPAPMRPALARSEALRAQVRRARAQVAATGQAGKVNLTDPEARGMKTRQGIRHGYNAQAVVVGLDPAQCGVGGRLVIATQVTTDPDDHAQLLPMVEAARIDGQPVALTLADAGYHSGPNLAACAEAGAAVAMPEANPPQQSRRGVTPDQFTYAPPSDTYHCPQGAVLTRRSQHQRPDGRLRIHYRADAEHCRDCRLREPCIGPVRGGRVLAVSQHEERHPRQWRAGHPPTARD